jgi:hypothetical protein
VKQKKSPVFASLNVSMQQKTVRRKKDCSDMDLAGDVGAFFILLKHHSNFFWRSDFAGDLVRDVGAIFFVLM